ncbi:MAG: hypothetical protein ACI8WB_004233 [Phenylobacterium sp.]|jgi:hypothetical protein
MSVLNFPRIYFNGEMEWNPPTGNNNDVLPLYDAVNVELNWDFLAALDPSITPDNVRTTLHPWMLTNVGIADVPDYVAQVPNNAGSFPIMPAEWDLFGDNSCGSVDYKQTRSTVIGGQISAEDYIDDDPLLNLPFQILGNPFGGTQDTPGRFVDVSPWQNTFTALYFDQLRFGDEQTGVVLKRQYRMLDRMLNFNWGAIGGLTTVTTTWQTCFTSDNIEWYEGDSALLKALRAKMDSDPTVKGLMVRFSTYLTFYDKNGIFNDYPPIDAHNDPVTLATMYEAGLENSSKIFFNPAYSCVAGTLGLWGEDEFPTAPGGRRLQANEGASSVTVFSAMQNQDISVNLGVAAIELNGQTLSLDVSNTFPFDVVDSSADIGKPYRFDVNGFSIGVNNDGVVTEIAQLSFADYNQAAFDKRSGIIDLPIAAEHVSLFNEGVLQVSVLGDTDTLVLTEQLFTAEIVESGTFMDVGETKTLNIMLHYKGKPVPAETKIWVAQYSNPYNITTSDFYLNFDDTQENTDFVLYNIADGVSAANLPQFVDSTAVVAKPAEIIQARRGKHCDKTVTAVPSADATPVGYREVAASPVGISLANSVEFVGGETINKTLDNSANTPIAYNTVQVATDATGTAQLTLKGLAAGFPTLKFSFGEQPNFEFSFSYTEAYIDFMAPIRVLPNNPDLLQEFVDKWNDIYLEENAAELIWQDFIYPEVLEVFYYLYPIMDKYMPLNQLDRIEGAVDQLIVLISTEYREESTLAMPITRDLPASGRAVLELWANKLVKRNYPPKPLSLP